MASLRLWLLNTVSFHIHHIYDVHVIAATAFEVGAGVVEGEVEDIILDFTSLTILNTDTHERNSPLKICLHSLKNQVHMYYVRVSQIGTLKRVYQCMYCTIYVRLDS